MSSLHSRTVQYYLNCAEQFKNKNRYENAIHMLDNAFELKDQHTEESIGIIFDYYADIYKMMKQYEKSIIYLEKRMYITKEPSKYLFLLNELGTCYNELNKNEQAIIYFSKIISMVNVPIVFVNISLCYTQLKLYKKAILYYKKGLENNNDIDMKHKIYDSLGAIYFYIKDYDTSLKYYNLCDMTNPNILYNMSFPYLAKKEFRKGLELYEKRLVNNDICIQTQKPLRVEIPFIMKRWDGKMPCNKLLIIYEKGIGDNIQYFRYIIELSLKFPTMIIHYFCKDSISHLLDTSQYPNVDVVDNVSIDYGYHYKLYIMSLPHILEMDDVIPNVHNYIIQNKSLNDSWKQRLNQLQIAKKRPKIGLVFNGLLNSFIDKQIEFNNISKLFLNDCDFICLHKKEDMSPSIKTFSNFHIFDIDKTKPFEDTISILNNVDLLITIDTSIVHMAGVMGIKTWLLLGNGSDWRWFNDDICSSYKDVSYIRLKGSCEFKNIIPCVDKKLLQFCKEF